jgi:predicted enzyme related to lactoylglutathione lyase
MGFMGFMGFTRIVANLRAPNLSELAKFYQEVFDFTMPLNMGWICFLTNFAKQKIELHTASQGGSGTELPLISGEVDDLDTAEASVRAAGADIVYGPVEED